MSRFDKWLEAAKTDADLSWAEQSCFKIKLEAENDFNKWCSAHGYCHLCALCNNCGDTHVVFLARLGIEP